MQHSSLPHTHRYMLEHKQRQTHTALVQNTHVHTVSCTFNCSLHTHTHTMQYTTSTIWRYCKEQYLLRQLSLAVIYSYSYTTVLICKSVHFLYGLVMLSFYTSHTKNRNNSNWIGTKYC